jgi:predicted dithiol-disulfide oxidoreductase (DUF899 family)
MADPQVVSKDEWLEARRALLAEEKELTRRRDEVNAQRRRLPMVEIGKEYVFEGPDGQASLLDLFEGRRQLIVHGFMFDPEWDAGCPVCSFAMDSLPHLSHLHARDVTFAAVSRAPFEKLAAYRERMGWTFPWYSSYGSDFNYDFHTTLDPDVAPVDYNFTTEGLPDPPRPWSMEAVGELVFLRDGERIFHTYSAYARGLEQVMGAYSWLDITALGRQEPFEEPKDRSDHAPEIRRHDEYPG